MVLQALSSTRFLLWWLYTTEPLVLMIAILVAMGLLSTAAALFYLSLDGLVWVQVRRRVQHLFCYIITLRRRRVMLPVFHEGVMKLYARAGFKRQLTVEELQQLACHAGFPQTAAASLARCLHSAAKAGGCSCGIKSQQPQPQCCQQQQGEQEAAVREQMQRLSAVGAPAWRYKYFLWWLQSHLDTLAILREEWEQEEPRLVCGFDVCRNTAVATLFRRPKGTFMVRLGMEVGGVIVSLRPDKAHLPEEQRTPESYFSSVSAAQLAGAAYEMAQQPWMPEYQKRREGAVVHVYIPNASLRTHGGLWGCLRRMRHTKHSLDTATGQLMPTIQAFKSLSPPLRPTAAEISALRDEALDQLRLQKQAAAAVAGEAAPAQQAAAEAAAAQRAGAGAQQTQPAAAGAAAGAAAAAAREAAWEALQPRPLGEPQGSGIPPAAHPPQPLLLPAQS